jgi:hypothetical protein
MAKDKETSQDKTTPVNSDKGSKKKEEKTFSQEELNQIVGKTREEVREQVKQDLSKEFEKKLQKEREEAERMAKLSAEEKEREIAERTKRENSEKERELSLRENKLKLKDLFVENGIDTEMVEIIATEDEEESFANAKKVIETYTKDVEKGVKEKLKNSPPKAINPSKNSEAKEMKAYY